MRSAPPSAAASGNQQRQPHPDSGKAGDTRLRVCVVCSGNICRSPIGEQVLRSALADAGLDDDVQVSSAGIGDWHVGQGANDRAVRVLRAAGYSTDHRARQITREDLGDIDLVLAADRGHLRDLRRMTSDHTKVALLRSFDPNADDDEVPDPYYGPDSGFDEVLAMTQAAVPGIIAEIRRQLGDRRQPTRKGGTAMRDDAGSDR